MPRDNVCTVLFSAPIAVLESGSCGPYPGAEEEYGLNTFPSFPLLKLKVLDTSEWGLPFGWCTSLGAKACSLPPRLSVELLIIPGMRQGDNKALFWNDIFSLSG